MKLNSNSIVSIESICPLVSSWTPHFYTFTDHSALGKMLHGLSLVLRVCVCVSVLLHTRTLGVSAISLMRSRRDSLSRFPFSLFHLKVLILQCKKVHTFLFTFIINSSQNVPISSFCLFSTDVCVRTSQLKGKLLHIKVTNRIRAPDHHPASSLIWWAKLLSPTFTIHAVFFPSCSFPLIKHVSVIFRWLLHHCDFWEEQQWTPGTRINTKHYEMTQERGKKVTASDLRGEYRNEFLLRVHQ